MPQELFWLTLTALMTALFWIPYVLNRIAVRGLVGAMANPMASDAPQSPWAERAQKAHRNAIENLAIFAPLVLVSHALEAGSSFVVVAAIIYFFARAAHYVIYAAGIPVARTLAFAVGAFAQLTLALHLLGLL